MKASQLKGAARPGRGAATGWIVAIVLVVVVLGGGAAAYYYLWHLPRTPEAVLTKYLALDEAGDFDGTYGLLSQRSRSAIPQDRWKSLSGQARDMLRQQQISVEYTLGEPKFTQDGCRIPVAAKLSGGASPPGKTSPAIEGQDSFTQTHIMVKERGGWRVGQVETLIEAIRDFGRKAGRTPEQIEQDVTQLEAALKQPLPKTGP